MGSAPCALGLSDRPDVLLFKEINHGWPVWRAMRLFGLDACLIGWDEYGEIGVVYGRDAPGQENTP